MGSRPTDEVIGQGLARFAGYYSRQQPAISPVGVKEAARKLLDDAYAGNMTPTGVPLAWHVIALEIGFGKAAAHRALKAALVRPRRGAPSLAERRENERTAPVRSELERLLKRGPGERIKTIRDVSIFPDIQARDAAWLVIHDALRGWGVKRLEDIAALIATDFYPSPDDKLHGFQDESAVRKRLSRLIKARARAPAAVSAILSDLDDPALSDEDEAIACGQ